MRSKDYKNIKDKFRPGHADFTYFKKYGMRDYRGGGRSSARETAARVAAGAIAKKVLEKKLGKKFTISAAVTQLGILGCDTTKWNSKMIYKIINTKSEICLNFGWSLQINSLEGQEIANRAVNGINKNNNNGDFLAEKFPKKISLENKLAKPGIKW